MTKSKLAGEHVVTAATPDAAASWIAAEPTDDEPPYTRITLPLPAELGESALGSGRSRWFDWYKPAAAVDSASGRTVASSNETESGIGDVRRASRTESFWKAECLTFPVPSDLENLPTCLASVNPFLPLARTS